MGAVAPSDLRAVAPQLSGVRNPDEFVGLSLDQLVSRKE
jgi:hypothetical protein